MASPSGPKSPLKEAAIGEHNNESISTDHSLDGNAVVENVEDESSNPGPKNKPQSPASEEDCLQENLLILENALRGTQPENNKNTHDQNEDLPPKHQNITEEVHESMDNNANLESLQIHSIDKETVDEIQAIDQKAIDEIQATDQKTVDDIQAVVDQVAIDDMQVIDHKIVDESQAINNKEPDVGAIHDANDPEKVDIKVNLHSSNEDILNTNTLLETTKIQISSENVIDMNISNHSNDTDPTMTSTKKNVEENGQAQTSVTETLKDNSDTNIQTNHPNDVPIEEGMLIQIDEKESKHDQLSDSDLKDLDDLDLEDLKAHSEPSDNTSMQESIDESVPENIEEPKIHSANFKCDKNDGNEVNMLDTDGKDSVEVYSELSNVEPIPKNNEESTVSLEKINSDLERVDKNTDKTEPTQNTHLWESVPKNSSTPQNNAQTQTSIKINESTNSNVQKESKSPETIVWESPITSIKVEPESPEAIHSEPVNTAPIEETVDKISTPATQNVPNENIKTDVPTPKWESPAKSTPINNNANENLAKKRKTKWDSLLPSKIAHTVNENLEKNISDITTTVQGNVELPGTSKNAAKLFWQMNAQMKPESAPIAPTITWEANSESSQTPNDSNASNRNSQSPSSIHDEVNMEVESDVSDVENESYEPFPQTGVNTEYKSMFSSIYHQKKSVLIIYQLPKCESWTPNRVHTLIANTTFEDEEVVKNIAHIYIENQTPKLNKAYVKFRERSFAAKALDLMRIASEKGQEHLMEGLKKIVVRFDKGKLIDWDENHFPIFRSPHPLANQVITFGNKYLSEDPPPQIVQPGPVKPTAVLIAQKKIKPAFEKSRRPPFVTSMDPTDRRYYGLSRDFLASLDIKIFPLTPIILVNNLDILTKENDIRNIFSMAGTIHALSKSVHKTNMSVRIRYDHPLEAVQAISMFKNQKVLNRVVSVFMSAFKGDKKIKLMFPLGVTKVGPGLGPQGTIIEGVRATIELAHLRNQCEKEIAALTKIVEETKMRLDEKTKELNTRVLARVISGSMLNPLAALGLLGVQNGIMQQISGQDGSRMAMNNAPQAAQTNTAQNQTATDSAPIWSISTQPTWSRPEPQPQITPNTQASTQPDPIQQVPNQQGPSQPASNPQQVPNPQPVPNLQPTQNPQQVPKPQPVPNLQTASNHLRVSNPQPIPNLQPVLNSQPAPPQTPMFYQQYPQYPNHPGQIMAGPFLPEQIMSGAFLSDQVMSGPFLPGQVSTPDQSMIQYLQSVQSIQYPQSVQSIQHPQSVQSMQHPQSVQSIQHPQSVQSIQHPQSVQSIQHPHSVQPIQHPQSTQPIQHPQIVQPIQHPQTVQPVQHPQSVQSIQHPQSVQPIQHPQTVQPFQHSQSVQPIQHPQSRFSDVQILLTRPGLIHPIPTTQNPQNIPLPAPSKTKADVTPAPPLPKPQKLGHLLKETPVEVAKPEIDVNSIPIPFNKSPTLTDVRARVTKKIAALKLPPLRLTQTPKAKPVAKPVPTPPRESRVNEKVKKSRSRSSSSSSNSDNDRPRKYRKSPKRSFKRAPEKSVREKESEKSSTVLLFKFLPPSVTAPDLREKMGELGRLLKVEMIAKGEALVAFRYPRDADTCIEMYDRSKVDDQYISVTKYFTEPGKKKT